jgi:hypothetical protein
MTRTQVDQRDGSEPGTAALLWTGAIVGVLLRGTTWVLSAFTVGPVLGLADTLTSDLTGRREMLFLQALLTVIAVLVTVMAGLGLQTDPARYRLPVRLLCALFILDILLYLAPVIFAVTVDIGLTTSAWALFAVAVLGNLGLAGLCVQIIFRSRRLRATTQPEPTAMIVLS